MTAQRLLIHSIKAGTIAALAMMPFGLALRASGLRVGYYGPKFAELFVAAPGPLTLFAQHIILGWISALPLVALMASGCVRWSPVAAGAAYGGAYYVAVNSLALPLYFGDKLPWQHGPAVILPSLLIHIVFGVTVALMARRIVPAKAI